MVDSIINRNKSNFILNKTNKSFKKNNENINPEIKELVLGINRFENIQNKFHKNFDNKNNEKNSLNNKLKNFSNKTIKNKLNHWEKTTQHINNIISNDKNYHKQVKFKNNFSISKCKSFTLLSCTKIDTNINIKNISIKTTQRVIPRDLSNYEKERIIETINSSIYKKNSIKRMIHQKDFSFSDDSFDNDLTNVNGNENNINIVKLLENSNNKIEIDKKMRRMNNKVKIKLKLENDFKNILNMMKDLNISKH